MKFLQKDANPVPIQDTVFQVVAQAKEAKQKYGEDQVVDATIGSLYDEEGKLVAYHTVFDTFDAIEPQIKAAYASSFTGNPNYRKQVAEWVFQGIHMNLPYSVLATPGGTGAISTVFHCSLAKNEIVLLPEVAWGSYKLMANEYGYQRMTYSLFEDDHFNLTDFEMKCKQIMDQQHKLVVVINDPCHNPTGYSLTLQEWEQVIAILNECSLQGPVVLLNDIAYIDYSYQLDQVRRYMELFQTISDNVAVVIAFSCSKTCTSYGLRIGAAILLAQKEEDVRQMEIVYEKHARATWSNIGNSGMENFVRVTTTHHDAFMKEKAKYIDLLKQRSDIFVTEAKACGLPIYPYKEGFFITIRIEDNEKCVRYHEALIANHIFTVRVNKGIRVAICSTSIKKTKGLAQKLKTIYDTI
ncbi:MAG: aminotransferase class I/II-fold pyridoxal phosphate-dependent enzyme [Erysipelotrichaceae bacterium]|nr:aminotransferase class I/II-fold pyridoxal phosphate-dependent enzyme [Erysipelotrichaceae bacterium]